MKRQNGFGIIETLLIILILVVAGFGGYYVWHNQQKAKPATTAATTKTSTTSTNQKYLTIKELGATIAVPDTLKGLAYSTRTGTSITGDPTTFVYFTSDEFKSYLTSCGATDMTADFAGASKASGTYPANPTPANSDGSLLKQFDGFYVEGSADQQSTPCSGEQKISTERSTLFNSLQDAFKSATLAQ